MFKSIILTSIRNIFRNKVFSAINFLGLSASMSLGLLIIVVIQEQFSYDHFHSNGDRIYRINTLALRKDGKKEPYASTPLPLGKVIRDNYAFAEQVVQIDNSIHAEASNENITVPIQGLYASPEFLQVFNFPLKKGDMRSTLQAPYSAVLTQQAASKLFGTSEAVGQMITLHGRGDFIVTGVLQPFPGSTHFDFEILASITSMEVGQSISAQKKALDDWNNYYSGYVYFKLLEGQSIETVEKYLHEISATQYANLTLETRDKGYEFYLQPLFDITPGPILSNQMGHGLPSVLIFLLVLLASIILLMACVNYTNLTIAKSLSRAREIGVRKIVGAMRFQVFRQFVGESIVFSLIALLISYGLLQLLKPALLQLQFIQQFSLQLKEHYTIYFYFIAFAVIMGIVAGLLPAGYLSAFNPVTVLKGSIEAGKKSKLTLRKALIVTQFMFSLVFIMIVMVIHNQVDYMVTKDYGITDKNTINVHLQGVSFSSFANEIAKANGVVSVGGVSHPLGTWADRSSDYKQSPDGETLDIRDFGVTPQYVENLEVTFLAGNNFVASDETTHEKYVILNEKALALFEFSDAHSAIGQSIFTDSVSLTVVGVVKDFHFRPLTYPIGPMAFRFQEQQVRYASIRVVPDQVRSVEESVKSVWSKMASPYPLEMSRMEKEIDDAYSQSGFRDILAIVTYAGVLTIIMACLGMLGMAMQAIQTRNKEMGIRKILGAESWQITLLLSRLFLNLIVIAICLGIPLGYFASNLILQNFAYQISISPLLILSVISFILLLTGVIIGSQTIRAASVNPLKFLRHD